MDKLPEAKLYIDGQLRRARGDKTYDNIGPWTGEVVGKAPWSWVKIALFALTLAATAFILYYLFGRGR